MMNIIWSRLLRLFFPIWILALASVSVASASTSSAAQAFNHGDWDRLLKKHVYELREGRATQVDYDGFLKDRTALKVYLKQLEALERTTFDRWPETERLAFLINAYNAWTIELILESYPELESIRDLGSWFQSPWKRAFIPLLGEVLSLDDIEHGLIRGTETFAEPRIHFAVNCASIGCPALGREAYTGENLDRQLENAAVKFLQDRSRNLLEGDRLLVSKIFKWYREDFEMGWRGADSLEHSLALYSEALGLQPQESNGLRQGSIEVEYLDYDWRLNKRQ